ncbi:sodium:alanine symporter family protein [Marinobacter nanhaiticus D15-8W]|uniref:Sodium:alanine symporter family protein n=1 Tax=Marinobacter nanhaiticus D15-8W TaxID=626887 RepID=N6WMZ6_9GAMM|nr:amino acid carrier protein [Marinobacter nanhaiticus]ENO12866.2 sodium:alanine symporter family protein [Marinobacter nanhaiticus D15-8W]BES70216.1 sodium:alanine symporter family protein [Marinobacter nanhaiticus D15-8W]
MKAIESFLQSVSNFLWGIPLIILLVGGGLFFLFYSRALPYRHFGHAIDILRGKHDRSSDPGDISHFQALSAALSGTLGMGNIAGVAFAVSYGGPSTVVWMWVTALVGVATKFFTCSLAIMYRGEDSKGNIQGGPMYVIREGLGRRWMPLAIFFCLAGLIGTLPVFQINQLTETMRDAILLPYNVIGEDQVTLFNFWFGLGIAALVAYVIFGGVRRVGYYAARLVPTMVVAYLLCVIAILAVNASQILPALGTIFTHALQADLSSVAAGGLMGVLITGIRQGAFSNEAGIGTEVMAHGAARTKEPIREGLVAMMGPVVDTLIVCTLTALVLLTTGVWSKESGDNVSGAALTAEAFAQSLGAAGPWIIMVLVTVFSMSTMFTFWYYGAKCLGFLIGAEHQGWYRYIYIVLIVVGAVISLKAVVFLITTGYALMAIPTMIASLLLAPKVMDAAQRYFEPSTSRR